MVSLSLSWKISSSITNKMSCFHGSRKFVIVFTKVFNYLVNKFLTCTEPNIFITVFIKVFDYLVHHKHPWLFSSAIPYFHGTQKYYYHFHKIPWLFSKEIHYFYGTQSFYYHFHKSPWLFSQELNCFKELKVSIAVFISLWLLIKKRLSFMVHNVPIAVFIKELNYFDKNYFSFI